jgi:hypothetical protein
LEQDESILPVQIPIVSCPLVNGYEIHDLSEECLAKKNENNNNNNKHISPEDVNKKIFFLNVFLNS